MICIMCHLNLHCVIIHTHTTPPISTCIILHTHKLLNPSLHMLLFTHTPLQPSSYMSVLLNTQYSSHLDELPAHLGGRSNSWRTLSLRPPPAHGMMYTHLESSLTGRVGVAHGRDLLLGTPPTPVACGEARLSRRRVGTLR